MWRTKSTWILNTRAIAKSLNMICASCRRKMYHTHAHSHAVWHNLNKRNFKRNVEQILVCAAQSKPRKSQGHLQDIQCSKGILKISEGVKGGWAVLTSAKIPFTRGNSTTSCDILYTYGRVLQSATSDMNAKAQIHLHINTCRVEVNSEAITSITRDNGNICSCLISILTLYLTKLRMWSKGGGCIEEHANVSSPAQPTWTLRLIKLTERL